MFYNLSGDVRSPFVLFTTNLIQNYCSQTKCSYSLRVVRPGRLYIVSVRDGFGSSSDLLKSWGECGGRVWSTFGVYLWCTVCYCPCHLWRALPYSAAPTVCIRLAGSLPIECCARSHMGNLYSVSELRGSICVICTTGHSLCFIYINKWPTRGFWNRISYCVLPVFQSSHHTYIYIYIYIYINSGPYAGGCRGCRSTPPETAQGI